jgi:hypothetical protein
VSKEKLVLADVPGIDMGPAVEAVKPECPPQYRGTKTYRLRQPHYRRGTYYEAGELITVTDEVPSRTWDLVVPKGSASSSAVPKAAAPKGRASDEQV